MKIGDLVSVRSVAPLPFLGMKLDLTGLRRLYGFGVQYQRLPNNYGQVRECFDNHHY